MVALLWLQPSRKCSISFFPRFCCYCWWWLVWWWRAGGKEMDCFHLNWSALSLHCKEKENNIMLLKYWTSIPHTYMQSSPPVLTNQKSWQSLYIPVVIHTRCQAKIIDDTSRSIVMQCAFVPSIQDSFWTFFRCKDQMTFSTYTRGRMQSFNPLNSSKPVDLYNLTTCRLQWDILW